MVAHISSPVLIPKRGDITIKQKHLALGSRCICRMMALVVGCTQGMNKSTWRS